MRFSILKHRTASPGRPSAAGPIRGLIRSLGELYAPTLCPVLDVETSADRPVSAEGMRILRRARLTRANRCGRCFLPLRDNRCSFCSGRNIYFDRHVSLFRLNPAWSRVLRRWKFENDRSLHRIFLPALRRELNRLPAVSSGGGLNRLGWIDSGRAGHELRAYTPCRDPALALENNPADFEIGPLLRKRPLRSQSSKDYTDRFMRIRDSFEFLPGRDRSNCKKMRNCRNDISPVYKSPVNYVLIEDVFTTGATANEAARVLREHGAASVLIISMLLREELDFF